MLLPSALDMDLDAALSHYEEHGYARLGRALDERGLETLRQRADDMMQGRLTYPGLFFQRDSGTGSYDDLRFGMGFEGPGTNYRKIEKLELDAEFRRWIENALFERVARRRIEGAITLYRAVLFNKDTTGGTRLPWHQDGGLFWGLDRNPTLQIWTALDDITEESGCVEILPGSHKEGLRTPFGGSISPEIVEKRGQKSLFLPAIAGEVLLLHNHTWHRSGLNRSGRPRRALSFCYMSGDTRCLRKKRAPRVFVPLFEKSGAAIA